MNPGEVWWNQIGTSLRFIESVSNSLRDCQSAVLQVPQRFPWRQDFYAAVDLKRTAYSGERRLVRIPWTEGAVPGEYVLDELCSSKVKADYWPGQTYAAYLASKGDILICEYYVWITGVHTKSDVEKWDRFIADYTHDSCQLSQTAVFIIEYDGPIVLDSSLTPSIQYEVAGYDCRVFALEVSASLNNTAIHSYQAELALRASNAEPEFCFALLEEGEKLIQRPTNTVQGAIRTKRTSYGALFEQRSENQIERAVWEAALIQLFPILERFRMGFVKKHEERLSNALPISNSYGEIITDPTDLEIGALYAIVTSARTYSIDEVEKIRLCRRVRNLLAHNKAVPFSEITATYLLE